MNSKWIKDLHVRLETIKILEESIDSKISDISLSNIFSDVSPQARETSKQNKHMGLYQTKLFCTAEETINEMQRQPTEWENIFANDTSDKGLIYKTYKELILYNSKPKKQTIQFKSEPRT